MLKKVGIAFLLLLAFAVARISYVRDQRPADSSKEPPPKASAEQVAEENRRFEMCRANLKKAKRLDLLYDLKMDPLPRVVVGPTFYKIPLDAKQGFADTVNCFVTAGKDEYVNFDLLDYRSGHVVAEYSYGRLSVK
jgi:hypothetical protein